MLASGEGHNKKKIVSIFNKAHMSKRKMNQGRGPETGGKILSLNKVLREGLAEETTSNKDPKEAREGVIGMSEGRTF